jgi:hypothetical protein
LIGGVIDMAIHEIHIQDFLPLIDILSTNQKIIKITDTLAFSQSGDGHDLNQSLFQNLYFGHDVSYSFGNRTYHVSQTLQFTQSAHRAKEASVYQLLPMWQVLDGKNKQAVSQTLTFTETVTAERSKGVQQQLVFTEVVGLNCVRVRSVSQALGFLHRAGIYKNSASWLSEPISFPVVPPTSLPALAPGDATRPHVQLSSSRARTLTFPAPQFGNKDELKFTRIQRNTRGGNLIIYQDPIWPKEEIFTLTWKWLTEAQREALFIFVTKTLGYNVTLIDHEGRSWVGVILTPESDWTQTGPNDRGIELQFVVNLNDNDLSPP